MCRPCKHPLRWFAALCLALTGSLGAQGLYEQPTPFSVWLDFQALASSHPPRISLPIWLESLRGDTEAARDDAPPVTTFRLRFRRLGDLNNEMQLRLFFDDQKDAAPTVTGWSETGVQRFRHGPLGTALGLPSSHNLTLGMTGVDYIDIVAPGDGRNLRGAFLASLRREEVRRALDFPLLSGLIDPFNAVPPATPKLEDAALYGRVRATLDSGVMRLTPRETPNGAWEFDLQAPPLLAVVTFEILNTDAVAAPEIIVNDRPLGIAATFLPDLADPGFVGHVRPLDRDMRFRYAGWLRCQKAIPGSTLAAGLNNLVMQLNKESGPVAIRAVELQLKYNWRNLDYQLAPAAP